MIATARAEGNEVTEDDYVSLVGVEPGSNRLTLALAAGLATAASVVSGSVATGAYDDLPGTALAALHEVSDQAAKRKWSVDFLEDKRNKVRAARISAEHPIPPPPRPPFATGTTSILGRCVRVGGATKPRAEIRLTTGGLLNIDVSEELARSLARNLYDEVCIEGVATWRTDDWSLESFVASRVTEYRHTDLVQAFERLSSVARGAWDGVDAEAYVHSLRSGEDEG